MSNPKIIALGGPTASGKSKLAIEIAKKFNGEIVNCDSRQFYVGMDIGTGKENISKRNKDGSVDINGITHYLIDLLKPNEEYNLFKFQRKAFSVIGTIIDKRRLPILVGGTGLYIDSIVYNYSLSEYQTDQLRRFELRKMTLEQLQVLAKDFISNLNESDRNNPHRLIRAIERRDSETPTPVKGDRKYDVLYLCINIEKEELEKRISKRVDDMFKNGLEKENAMLRKSGYSTKNNAMKSIGYQEFDGYYAKDHTIEETKELVKTHTMQYAKRQMTWFRRNPEIRWIPENNQ
ncbi:MAG: tRNA (adenosine(37)-N6)-dimethylallyltransferase MiaA, partial [bacterium]